MHVDKCMSIEWSSTCHVKWVTFVTALNLSKQTSSETRNPGNGLGFCQRSLQQFVNIQLLDVTASEYRMHVFNLIDQRCAIRIVYEPTNKCQV